MAHTIVGVFDAYSEAGKAVDKLVNGGISRDAITVHTTEDDLSIADEARAQNVDVPLPTTEFTGSRGALKVLERIERFFDGVFRDDDKPEDTEHYLEAARRGCTVITVNVDDDAHVQTICRTLWEAGAVDLEERVSHWRTTGYTGFRRGAPVYTQEEAEAERRVFLSRRGTAKPEFKQDRVRAYPRRALE